MKRFNTKTIIHIMGILLLFNGSAMGVVTMVSYFFNDGALRGLLLSTIITLATSLTFLLTTKSYPKVIRKREGYIVVVLGWLIMVVFGTLPYLLTTAIADITNAFFETMSGFTTTGATILNDIEGLPKSIILWRSITHWMGGMGIIVLAIAILPLLGIGGVQLFTAEAPGLGGDKLHPRISDTAKRLWLIYVGLTLLESLLLLLAGMSLFDAVNHAMSTMASGGFSTKNASLAHWNSNPFIQYIIILFMFLAGTNFVLIYFCLKGKFKNLFFDNEFRWYFTFVVSFALICSITLFFSVDLPQITGNHPQVFGKFESSIRHSIFQVVAVITTTGFVTSDFTAWTPFITMLFFGIMFLGGSSGSTSGGMKVLRHLIMIKNGFLEFKRVLHPNAILSLRFNNVTLEDSVVYKVLAFFILYMITFIIGAGVLSLFGLDFISAIGGSVSSLSNVGPALGSIGPSHNFFELPIGAKWWCSFLMIVGRLELFTILILFTPSFWRDH